MFGKGRRNAKDGESGAVTVFLILILAVMFGFIAVFIDYARIAALHVQTERLTHAAVRSVMSAYDPALQQDYGLFAYGESSGEQIMVKVLNDSAKRTSRADTLPLMNTKLDSSSLHMERELGKYAIFNEQIREEMKYKAPVDFTVEVLEKLKPLSQNMKEASHTVDLLKRLQKLYDKREARLDDMLEKQREAGAYMEEVRKRIIKQRGAYIPNQYIWDSLEVVADIAAQYKHYVHVYEDNKLSVDDVKIMQMQEYARRARSALDRLSQAMTKIGEEHDKLLVEAKEPLNEARQINEEMRQVIAQYKQRAANAGYDEVSAAPTPSGGSSSADPSVGSARQKADDLLIPDKEFDQMEATIEKQRTAIHTINNRLTSMIRTLSFYTDPNLNADMFRQEVISTLKEMDKYLNAYAWSGPSNVLDDEARAMDTRRGPDKERKKMEKEAKNKLKQAYRIIEMLSKGTQSAGQFQKLEQYYNESISFNQSASSPSVSADLFYDTYDAAGASMDSMDGLYGAASGLLTQLGDEFFQNEYALSYFNHVDFSRFGSLAGSGGSVGNASQILGDQLELNNQEVEYILYGFHNPTGNLASAYGEIFAMRLAIRTMEGLVKNSSKGNPLVVLAAALLYGVEKAIEDMIMLAQKGYVPLSDFLKFRMTYKDHLRLFLMIHSNNERKMSRMLALIRLNTDVNPAERQTYARGEVKNGMRLLFLPGVMKMLGTASEEGESIKGSVYYVTKTAHFSY
ncbi:hypothetical protein HPL003_14645 [Paenibacillus terrae HPL-003]|uniref:Uncharacterized protein n=1 Tax=Paenibacillus terrae (strain HPL-003) TaxID=985665 RepID=G7W296_PAETH|nr:hypothetical protein [Paenibacillus terrae]AET59680.1 hypothetical protein HPL003_14645 [Paenibacillus terrae HPL-003]